MPVKAPRRTHYAHKKPAKHFLKVYWPYLPLAISVGLSILLTAYWQPFSLRHGVLAYATNTSVSGLLDATNKERASSSQSALKINSKLNSAAQAKANDMAERNYWSHVTPDGKQPWYFFDQAGYDYQKAGENLAYGFDSSSATVAGWMNSPSHKANMLDGQFLDVGFGMANSPDYQDSGPQTIVVAMYGRPVTVAAPAPAPTASPTAKPKPSPNIVNVPVVQKVEEPVANPETLGGKEVELPAQNISIAQALTGGNAPWSGFAIGSLMGGLLVYLLLKHGLALRRAFVQSERFILHHPLLDITILSYIVLGIILSQSTGIIR